MSSWVAGRRASKNALIEELVLRGGDDRPESREAERPERVRGGDAGPLFLRDLQEIERAFADAESARSIQ